MGKEAECEMSSRQGKMTVFSFPLIPPFNDFPWTTGIGRYFWPQFCHSCDTTKQHWDNLMLYDVCEHDAVFSSLPQYVSLGMYMLCLVSLDQSFVPLLGELRRNTTKKVSRNFPFPLLLFILSRTEELIQLFILEPKIELHINKTIKGDFQYKCFKVAPWRQQD